MDGYTKAAIKDVLAKRSPRQVKFDDFMERLVNGLLSTGLRFCFMGFGVG